MKENNKEKDKKQIFILDASAGTGKTYNLSLKYLYYIFHPSKELPTEFPFKNILAITFTNKAAKEMKSRIIELLKKICLDKFKNNKEKEIILKKLKISLNEQIKKQTTEFLELLFKNYQYFQVKTIDSFVNNLITNCALLLNISPNFKIEKEIPEYIDYCVDLLIEKAKTDDELKDIFKGFVYNFLIIEDKKSWFPEKFILIISKLLYKSTQTYGVEFKKVNTKKFHQERLNLNSEIIRQLEQLYSFLNEDVVYKNFISAIEKVLNKSKQKGYVIVSDDFTEWFLTQEKIPVKKNRSVLEEVESLWKDTRKKIFQLIKHEMYNTYDSYIEVFNYIEEEMKKIAKQKNIIFLEELNNLFNKIISYEILPEIYLRLSARIYHYLIDEFQDTNILQWKNLYPLIYESISSQGTLFIVGDKKQSIYRFRGGEPKLFDKIETDYFAHYGCYRDYLTQNYRSKKSIVEFNNIIFSQENLERFCKSLENVENIQDIISEIENVYSNTKQEYVKNESEKETVGYVYGELVDIPKDQEYEDIIKPKLINLINKLISQKYNYSDISILLRTNSEVRTITEWLIQENIPVESEQTLDVRKNKLIKEIVSLLKFLVNKEDNLSFCSFILGDIFLKVSKIEKEEIQKFIFLQTKNKKNHFLFYQYFKQYFPNIWEQYFSNLIRDTGSLPLYDIVLRIYSIFNVLENFPNYYGFFMLLLELIHNQDEKNSSIEDFISYFENPSETEKENFYVKVKKSNSIKITTIHKSKGLEYNIVLLPLLSIDIEVGKQQNFTSKFIIKEENKSLKIIKVKSNFRDVFEEAKIIYNEEFKKILIDELNAVYVAFTRAKERLYFFVPKKENSNNKNFAENLIPWNEDKKFIYGKEEFKTNFDAQPKDIQKISIGKYNDWTKKIIDEESFPKRQKIFYKKEITKGDVLHKVLSYINDLSNKDVVSELKDAIQKAKFYFPYITYWDEIEELIFKFISNKNIKPYFFIGQKELYCEKEIVAYGKIFRIDRLIVSEKEVLVVDYKLSFKVENSILEEYISQVEQYKKILSDIYKNKTIKGFLLFLDNFEILEV